MKSQFLSTILLATALTSCGGSGSSGNLASVFSNNQQFVGSYSCNGDENMTKGLSELMTATPTTEKVEIIEIKGNERTSIKDDEDITIFSIEHGRYSSDRGKLVIDNYGYYSSRIFPYDTFNSSYADLTLMGLKEGNILLKNYNSGSVSLKHFIEPATPSLIPAKSPRSFSIENEGGTFLIYNHVRYNTKINLVKYKVTHLEGDKYELRSKEVGEIPPEMARQHYCTKLSQYQAVKPGEVKEAILLNEEHHDFYTSNFNLGSGLSDFEERLYADSSQDSHGEVTFDRNSFRIGHYVGYRSYLLELDQVTELSSVNPAALPNYNTLKNMGVKSSIKPEAGKTYLATELGNRWFSNYLIKIKEIAEDNSYMKVEFTLLGKERPQRYFSYTEAAIDLNEKLGTAKLDKEHHNNFFPIEVAAGEKLTSVFNFYSRKEDLWSYINTGSFFKSGTGLVDITQDYSNITEVSKFDFLNNAGPYQNRLVDQFSDIKVGHRYLIFSEDLYNRYVVAIEVLDFEKGGALRFDYNVVYYGSY